MSKVLLIEDEGYWLDLIRQALPQYDVAPAQSYDKAMELLTAGVAYDVAIVDLNLLETGNDGLGRELLQIMKDNYPSTRRVALTGSPPTAVRALFEQYEIDDLLLKSNMVLEVVRHVVDAAVGRVTGDVPANLKVGQAELRFDVLSWESRTRLALEQRMHTPQNDVREAQRAGRNVAETSVRELEALEASQRDLKTRCSELMMHVANICNDHDLARAQQEFEIVKDMFGA